MKKIFSQIKLFIFLCFLSLLIENVSAQDLKITYPLFSTPAIVKQGSNLTITLNSASALSQPLEATLKNKFTVIELGKANVNVLEDKKTYTLAFKIPADTPEELYDLEILPLKISQPHSVKVIKEFKNNFSFIQITDVHIGFAGNFYGKPGMPYNNEIFKKVIEEVNLLNPEFVVITGDLLMSAEDFGRILMHFKEPHMATTDEKIKGLFDNEYNQLISLLNLFEVPVFIIPGNHDLVGIYDTPALQYWNKYFGPRYFSFNYSDNLFVGVDNSNMMEATTFVYPEFKNDPYFAQIDKEQVDFLNKVFAENSSSKLKILFCHVPTNKLENNLKKIIKDNKVNMVLSGHYHRDNVLGKETVWVETKSVLDFGGYRLINIKDNQVISFNYDDTKSESLSAYKLLIKFLKPNNGTSAENSLTITNNLKQNFYNVLIKFIMPTKYNYVVDKGKIIQTISTNKNKIIYLSVDIKANSKTTVNIIKKK